MDLSDLLTTTEQILSDPEVLEGGGEAICSLYQDCPYWEDCEVFESGHASARCYLMEGE